ncbi:MAG: hypothetical protein PHN82_05670 [bacterium]|nr:hypothetical protein [bacterium]
MNGRQEGREGGIAGVGGLRRAARGVGIAAVVIGGADLLAIALSVFLALSEGRPGFADVMQIVSGIAFVSLIPAARLASGCGLLRARPWGRTIAIVVFTIDFLLGLANAVIMAVNCHTIRFAPEPLYDALLLRASLQVWPTYLMALVGLLIVAVLSRSGMREALAGGGAGRGAA